jgi:aryl-alcohol dehydrogenase-like predicted oxidoreductase
LPLRGRAEEILGNWIDARHVRGQVVLATKVGKGLAASSSARALSRDAIRLACEDSLRRLRTDYIDLYQIHVPDRETAIHETLCALDDLVRAGKVRAVGCSNYSIEGFVEALWTSQAAGLVRFESHQLRYNQMSREVEAGLLPLCAAYDVAVLAYSPLAGGKLIDRRAALHWVISQPGITSALVGASRPQQIEDTLAAWNQSAAPRRCSNVRESAVG